MTQQTSPDSRKSATAEYYFVEGIDRATGRTISLVVAGANTEADARSAVIERGGCLVKFVYPMFRKGNRRRWVCALVSHRFVLIGASAIIGSPCVARFKVCLRCRSSAVTDWRHEIGDAVRTVPTTCDFERRCKHCGILASSREEHEWGEGTRSVATPCCFEKRCKHCGVVALVADPNADESSHTAEVLSEREEGFTQFIKYVECSCKACGFHWTAVAGMRDM